MQENLLQQYLTGNDICLMLNIAKSTFYRLIHDPDIGLPAIRLEYGVRVPLDTLNKWLEKQRVKPWETHPEEEDDFDDDFW